MRLFILLSTVLLLSFSVFGQAGTFDLDGELSGSYTGKIYLFYNDHYKHRDSIWTEVKDGRFHFHESIPGPVMGRLYFEGDHSLITDVYLEKGHVILKGTVSQTPLNNGKDTMWGLNITAVAGSDLETTRRAFADTLQQVSGGTETAEEENRLYYAKLKAFVQQHPASPMSPYLVSDLLLANSPAKLSYEQTDSLASLFDSSLRDTYEMKLVRARLKVLWAEPRRSVGSPFYDVALHDTAGHIFDTKTTRGKYCMVVFWASWCGPCMEEQPGWNAVYRRYVGQHFCMVGVSLDTDGAKWKKAIAAKALAYTQVSDLDKSNKGLVEYYNLTSIPYSLLIDPAGKIVEKGLTPEQTEHWLSSHHATFE